VLGHIVVIYTRHAEALAPQMVASFCCKSLCVNHLQNTPRTEG